MKWEKKGLLIKPGKYEWMVTHAQNPFAEHIAKDRFKIHFAGRDKYNMARGGFAEWEISSGKVLIYPKPTLTLGELGAFDDCGVMPSCIVTNNEKKYMYYTGWKQARLTPFSFFIGLALSKDNGKTYHRYSKAPVLGRSKEEPFLTCSPWVIIEQNIWKMWYVSGTGWEIEEERHKPKHYYHIRYAESKNGIDWKPKDVCIDFKKGEYAIARPTVWRENGEYKMLYSFRGDWNRYRIGFAESNDGKKWVRKDKDIGINISNEGWDSEMVCYGCTFDHKNNKYLLYNGNSYGATGCGYAVLKREH